MKLRVGLLSWVAFVMISSCKSRPSRPDFQKKNAPNLEIEEPVSSIDSGVASPAGSNPPFQTPVQPIVQPMDPVVTLPSPTEGAASERPAITLTLYGLGLYNSIATVVGVDKLSEDKLPADRDGTYAVGCKPFKTKEWKATGIEFEGGRLHGIDLYFDNELCEGKATGTGRDSKSISYSDYEKTLADQKIAIASDAKGLTITLPSGESALLNKLSFAAKKIGSPIPSGELPMGTKVIKYGIEVSNFVRSTLGTLSEPDPLLNNPSEEIYVQSCKQYGSKESYSEVLKIRGGLLYGAMLSYANPSCTGESSGRLEDHDGVNFADYTRALAKYGSSVSKLKDHILISDRNPDGYARQTLLKNRNLPKSTLPFPVLDGLGTTKYIIDAVRPRATGNDSGLKISDGYFIRSCEAFTKKTWKASGLYIIRGIVYGVELYFNNDTCSGKALSGASDQYNEFFANYVKAVKLQGATVSLDSPDSIALDYATGASVEYVKTNVTLP